jgi:hypothetical protein
MQIMVKDAGERNNLVLMLVLPGRVKAGPLAGE